MKKERITIDQLEAGALLKFGRLDSIDMTLLMGDISNFADVVNNDYEYMNEYFINENNRMINKNVLEKMQGSVVKKYLDNLEMKEFVLRKIKLLGKSCTITNGDMNRIFSVSQMRAVNWLYQEGCIVGCCESGMIHTIKLTKRGELYLFLINNKKEVEEFIKLLKDHGYSDLLFDAYLISQNLEEDSKNILVLDRFIKFNSHNSSTFWELTEREYGYKKVRVPIKEKK